MGSFEDSIKKEFEGKSVKAPNTVWSSVENGLNADFVTTYQTRQLRYKWVAAAAILLAFCSLAFQFSPIYSSGRSSSSIDGKSYNALLTNGAGFSEGFQISNSFLANRSLEAIPKYTPNTASNMREVGLAPTAYENMLTFQGSLDHRTADLRIAELDLDIYRYHQGGGYTIRSNSRRNKENKLWAGVEAGAGNFSSSLASSNVYAGSINQSNLASALGSDGFVNPSTEVNPDLNNGIATSLGLDVGMRLGDKWTLETGIAYTNVDSRGDATINVLDIYTVDNSEFFGPRSETGLPLSSTSRETSFEVEDSYDYDVDLRSNLRFTSLPVKAGYYIMDRKMSLRLNVGLAANYFIGSQVTAQNEVLSGSIDESFNAWSFDGLGGFEIGYSIFDNFDVTLEPNYRQSITPLTDANASESRFLVQTGLKYRIR